MYPVYKLFVTKLFVTLNILTIINKKSVWYWELCHHIP